MGALFRIVKSVALVSTVALAVASGSVARADQTRFGYVVPTAIQAATQPVLEHFSNDLQQAFARQNAIATVTIERSPNTVADLGTCKRLQLSGYLKPRRHWQVTSNAMIVTAGLVVLDCYGNVFYDSSVTKSVARDANVTPQIQVDSVGADATSDLLRKFASFKSVHRSTWDLLAATGSIVNPPASF
jgi:hypothetical protein